MIDTFILSIVLLGFRFGSEPDEAEPAEKAGSEDGKLGG
jgi:hypothetical protein